MSTKRCFVPFGDHGGAKTAVKVVSEKIITQARFLMKKGLVKNRVDKNMFLCETCRKKLGKEYAKFNKEESSSQSSSQSSSESQQLPSTSPLQKQAINSKEVKEKVNELLILMNLAKIDERKFRGKGYRKELISLLNENLSKVFEVDANIIESEILEQLKEKFKKEDTTRSDQLKILSVLPKSWSPHQISHEFSVTDYTANRVKKLVADHGILFETEKKVGRTLDESTIIEVRSFFRSDHISRVCPGKRDCKTTTEDGLKSQKQLRLVLMNLNEAYEIFKEEHPLKMLSFSKFAELRPKECILAGQTNGIHVTCVCQKHQNVSLEFECLKKIKTPNFDSIENIIKSMLCSKITEACELNECTKCSNEDTDESKEKIQEKISNLIIDFENMGIEDLKYKQWVKIEGNFSFCYCSLFPYIF